MHAMLGSRSWQSSSHKDALCIVDPLYSEDSQGEITLKVEMEYRLFLAIDMSLYRH